jgi:hypothetical protein
MTDAELLEIVNLKAAIEAEQRRTREARQGLQELEQRRLDAEARLRRVGPVPPLPEALARQEAAIQSDRLMRRLCDRLTGRLTTTE